LGPTPSSAKHVTGITAAFEKLRSVRRYRKPTTQQPPGARPPQLDRGMQPVLAPSRPRGPWSGGEEAWNNDGGKKNTITQLKYTGMDFARWGKKCVSDFYSTFICSFYSVRDPGFTVFAHVSSTRIACFAHPIRPSVGEGGWGLGGRGEVDVGGDLVQLAPHRGGARPRAQGSGGSTPPNMSHMGGFERRNTRTANTTITNPRANLFLWKGRRRVSAEGRAGELEGEGGAEGVLGDELLDLGGRLRVVPHAQPPEQVQHDLHGHRTTGGHGRQGRQTHRGKVSTNRHK